MTVLDEPLLTICDLCHKPTAAMPGPRWRRGRPEPPAGHEYGFLVEQADRFYTICAPCLASVIHTAA
jgi:hypothetical protein